MQSITRPYSRPQIPALTGLRFFAAFFVLWGHSMDWLAPFKDSRIDTYLSFFAVPAMSLFFVLSGFVIHYNYRDLFLRSNFRRALFEFASARFARLYPLYFIALLIAISADDFLIHFPPGSQTTGPVLAHFVTLTQSWWYTVYNRQLITVSFFPVSWSISTEMFFYAAYPAVVFLIASVAKGRLMIWIAVFYVGLVLAALIVSRAYQAPLLQMAESSVPDYLGFEYGENSFYRWFFYYSPYTRVLEFLLGCMTAQATMQLSSRPASSSEFRWAGLALAVALFLLLVISVLEVRIIQIPIISDYVSHLEQSFLCAPPIAVILFCVTRYKSWFVRLLSLPLLVALGEMSYSIYLLHTWTLRLFKHPAGDLNLIGLFNVTLSIVCGIALTILLAYSTYRLIEIPGRRWLRRSLGAAISVIVHDTANTGLSQSLFPRPALAKQAALSISVTLILIVIILGGEAVRSDRAIGSVRNLLIHNSGSEIIVLSASYGLNCDTFGHPRSIRDLVLPGNVTEKVKHFCRFSANCDVPVDVNWFIDPADGCAKDFRVAYACTGEPGIKTGYLTAEASGKNIELKCPLDGTGAGSSPSNPVSALPPRDASR